METIAGSTKLLNPVSHTRISLISVALKIINSKISFLGGIGCCAGRFSVPNVRTKNKTSVQFKFK